ncbi:MAG TPA: hypothetical protein VE152_00145 [Acidimicrobiales bacterium]|nr:hypothetical protein [Acidimicrobiales bacterium]
MHPIERLRFVARAGGAPPSSLVREAAGALAGLAEDQAALVTACRRLIDRHPQIGPMWWLAARVLSAPDPKAEMWRVIDELDGDPTGGVLAANLPDGAAVVILGWPELVGSAIRHRADLGVLLVDTLGEGSALARRLRSSGGDVVEVPEAGLGAAVGSAALVLVEALAMGEDGAVAVAGSWAAAAVARSAGVPTWLVAGVGRVLPVRLWEAVSRRLDEDADEPWDRAFDVVPLDLVDRVVGPAGVEDPGRALGRADCPIVPELLRPMVG